MDEMIEDFNEWAKTISVESVEYFAIFNQESGEIQAVYPSSMCKEHTNKIKIDDDIAISIFQGITTLESYVVNLLKGQVEFVEVKSLKPRDDLFHRIIEKRWSNIKNPDILLEYKNKKIIVSVSDEIKNKKILYKDNTRLDFYVTDYNNPYMLLNHFSVSLDRLLDSSFEMDIILPKEFSVYTIRLLENYVIENYEIN